MKALKIGLIGVGNMGSRIEELAQKKGHSITAMFKSNFPFDEKKFIESAGRVDVWIDFSHSSITERLVKTATENNIKLVIGTTGWYDKMSDFKTKIESSQSGLIWASNFSVGMFAFSKIVSFTSQLMSKIKEYDVALHEIHHTGKADAPSGTAKTLSEIVFEPYKKQGIKTAIQNYSGQTEKVDPHHLLVSSTRLGKVVGEHEIYFDSTEDTITLQHHAKNRDGFALGAILAAEWISEKNGFFSLDDLFADLLK